MCKSKANITGVIKSTEIMAYDIKTNEIKNFKLDPQGFSVHNGSANSGHYFTVIKTSSGWIKKNGPSTKPIEPGEAEKLGHKATSIIYNIARSDTSPSAEICKLTNLAGDVEKPVINKLRSDWKYS